MTKELNLNQKLKLAIVSSYDEGCGNASYSHALKVAFSEVVDVDVLALNLNLLQRRGSFTSISADEHIREIAAKLRSYDLVNIQFEVGLYGQKPVDIFRRFAILAEASLNLIVTMHRVDPLEDEDNFSLKNKVKSVLSSRHRRKKIQSSYPLLYKKIVDYCQVRSLKKNTWICVHTKRELTLVRDVYKMKQCFDFPLAFLLPHDRADVLGSSKRGEFLRRYQFPENAKVVGVFGFFGQYKGVETALRALHLLPSNYYLGIFGGVHPQIIRPNTQIDPYLNTILRFFFEPEVKLDQVESHREAFFNDFRFFRLSRNKISKYKNEPNEQVYFSSHGRNTLMERARFIGSLSDPHFFEALTLCDAVVLPYLEVGQSMSGVFALATELKAKLYCANNHSFNETLRYYGDVAEVFDIGNYIQLMQKIKTGARDRGLNQEVAYSKYNVRGLVGIYLKHFGVSVSDDN